MDEIRKLAESSLQEAVSIARLAGGAGMRIKLGAALPKLPSAAQQLRATASSSWRMGASPPKPKSMRPNGRIGDPARTRSPAKPPSKKAFYRDMVLGMDPSYGNRMAVKG